MKLLVGKSFFLFVLLFFSTVSVFAQLSFPKDHNLSLVTSTSILYFETEVRFYTGKFEVGDYDAIKVSDSIDNRWFVTACINGECWSNNPDSSRFVQEFGINDTTGFIRFHVDCLETEGSSTIKYLVKNHLDKTDNELLTFRITYKKPNEVKEIVLGKSLLNFYSIDGKPINTDLKLDKIPDNCQVYDINGKLLKSFIQPSGEIILNLDKGIYLLVVNIGNQRFVQKMKI